LFGVFGRVKARQPEGQMPVMLASYSTNKIIVLKRYVNERRKKNTLTRQTTHAHKQTVKQRNAGGVKYWIN